MPPGSAVVGATKVKRALAGEGVHSSPIQDASRSVRPPKAQG